MCPKSDKNRQIQHISNLAKDPVGHNFASCKSPSCNFSVENWTWSSSPAPAWHPPRDFRAAVSISSILFEGPVAVGMLRLSPIELGVSLFCQWRPLFLDKRNQFGSMWLTPISFHMSLIESWWVNACGFGIFNNGLVWGKKLKKPYRFFITSLTEEGAKHPGRVAAAVW